MKDLDSINDKEVIDDMYLIQEYTYGAYLKISNAYDALQDVIRDYFDNNKNRKHFIEGGALAEIIFDTVYRQLITLTSMFYDGLAEFEINSGLDTDRAKMYTCDMSILVKQYTIMRDHQKREKLHDLANALPKEKLPEALEIAEKAFHGEGEANDTDQTEQRHAS